MDKVFKEKIFEIVKGIPAGGILTYKDVAYNAGRPKAYRAVGNILSKNYNKDIPCHRVVRSDGKVGGYNRGQARKILLLRHEGVKL